MKIAIPSAHRADILKDNALAFISRAEVSFTDVYVFTNAASYQDYLQIHPDLNIITSPECETIQGTRNYIRQYFADEEIILGIDDDVNGLQHKNKETKRLVDVHDLVGVYLLLVDNMLINQTALAGLNMVSNPFFMDFNVRLKNSLIPACFYVFKNDRTIKMECPYGLSEDGELSIRTFKKYGSVVRLNYMTFKMLPNKKTSGGLQATMQPEDRTRDQQASDRWLQAAYPEYCAVKEGGVGLRFLTPKTIKGQEKLF